MTNANVALVKDWFKAGLWSDAGLAMTTETVEWVLPTTIADAVVDGRRLVGAEGLRELGYLSVAMYAQREPTDVQFTIGGDDWVVMQTRVRARLHNGAQYSNSYCFTFRIAGGKVAEVHEHFDSKLLYDLALSTPDDLIGVRQRIEQARADGIS
ncbi:MAG: nuclear transport factor 2 family protein [Acidimicrobiia bacterium]